MKNFFASTTNYRLKNRCGNLIAKLGILMLLFLISVGDSIAERTNNEKLHYGVIVRDIAMIQSALRSGADPNHASKDGRSPLWIAATDQNPEVVELLLKSGGNPNQFNHQGTPLLIAASRVINASRDNSSQILWLLIRFGADIEIMDKKKHYRPLTMAATFGTYSNIKTLLENGANPNNVPDSGVPVLFALTRNKHCKLDCLELLLANGADPDLSAKKGNMTYRERIVKSADRAKIEMIEKYFPANK